MTERRVIAITGASAGIGAALALRAARAGYAVVAVGRNGEALHLLEERIRHETGSIATLIGDVRDSGTSKAVAQCALERFGRLDVLVANAGVAGRGPLVLQTDEELLEQLETHIAAPITLVRACLPLLIASRGTVFVLGSGVGRIPIAGMGLYPASKAGLRSAARTLRNELKPMKIGLTYVDPGAVDTEFMHRRSMPGAPKFLLTSPFVVAGKILRAVNKRPSELNVVAWQTALLGALEHFPKAVDFALRHAGSVTGAPVMKLDRSGATAFERLRDVAEHADSTPGVGAPYRPKPSGGNAFIPGAGEDEAPAVSPAQARTESPPLASEAASGKAVGDAARGQRNGRTRGAESRAAENSPFDTIVSDFHSKASGTINAPIGNATADHASTMGAASSAASNPSADAAGASKNAPERPTGATPPIESAAAPVSSRAEIDEVLAVPSRSASQRSPKIASDDDALSIVLTPYMQRMRRQNLSLEMLRARIVGGNPFSEDEFALDWVGMPNKNERKLIADVCRACADGGLLADLGDRRWQGKGANLVGDRA